DANGRLNSMVDGAGNGPLRMRRCWRQFDIRRAWKSGIGRGSACQTICGVGVFCLIAWALRLSVLVKLISDSVLVGFKAGAGLTIAITQLPALFGVTGGGHDFFERAVLFAGQVGQ